MRGGDGGRESGEAMKLAALSCPLRRSWTGAIWPSG